MRVVWFLLVVLLLTVGSAARNMLWHDEIGIWKDTIQKSPRKFRAYNELALGQIARGSYEPAYESLVRSLELNPYQHQIYINLGLVFEHLERFSDAVKMYQRALWLQPADPTAYYNLGVLEYRTFGNHERALKYFLQARDRDPLEPDVHEYLSFLYEEQGKTALARSERILYDRLRPR